MHPWMTHRPLFERTFHDLIDANYLSDDPFQRLEELKAIAHAAGAAGRCRASSRSATKPNSRFGVVLLLHRVGRTQWTKGIATAVRAYDGLQKFVKDGRGSDFAGLSVLICRLHVSVAKGIEQKAALLDCNEKAKAAKVGT